MATITIDFDFGFPYQLQEVTLDDASNTLIFDPPAESAAPLILRVIQGTGVGAKLATWPSEVQWAAGVPPTLSIGAGAVDVFDFVAVNNGDPGGSDFEYYGRVFAQNLL